MEGYNSSVIEILTEEPSMEVFLKGILPNVLPDDYKIDVNCFIRAHRGKSDLKKSIPKKMRAYLHYGYSVKVLIIHDQDANDCRKLKNELVALCGVTTIPFMVRIACRELENWYLGELLAIEKAYPETKASASVHKAKYRNPDLLNGADELMRMTSNFSKTYAAREISKYMDVANNTSTSFNHTINAIRKLVDNRNS
jgi:hypothetical protein